MLRGPRPLQEVLKWTYATADLRLTDKARDDGEWEALRHLRRTSRYLTAANAPSDLSKREHQQRNWRSQRCGLVEAAEMMKAFDEVRCNGMHVGKECYRLVIEFLGVKCRLVDIAMSYFQEAVDTGIMIDIDTPSSFLGHTMASTGRTSAAHRRKWVEHLLGLMREAHTPPSPSLVKT
eukprot:Sspe_Gene.100697::Locus_75364_Transcript_1_1_Confidence_1.000_Length_593::g.100697::m.100697